MAAGLVSYASSDDDDGDEGQQARSPQLVTDRATPNTAPAKTEAQEEAQARPAAEPSTPAPSAEASKPEPGPKPEAERHDPRPVVGPGPQSAVPIGPSLPPTDAFAMADDDDDQGQAAPSPYSANRALIHDLTLPSVPNLDIPPSPPGSPPPRASKNFEQFLALKKKGTHFNAKLEQSTALRNPGVMDKLLEFVGLDGAKQYETTLSPDLWDPNAFPESAFVDKLRKSRDKLAKEREADRSSSGRTSVDFVPAASTSAGTASVTGGLTKGEKRKVAWK